MTNNLGQIKNGLMAKEGLNIFRAALFEAQLLREKGDLSRDLEIILQKAQHRLKKMREGFFQQTLPHQQKSLTERINDLTELYNRYLDGAETIFDVDQGGERLLIDYIQEARERFSEAIYYYYEIIQNEILNLFLPDRSDLALEYFIRSELSILELVKCNKMVPNAFLEKYREQVEIYDGMILKMRS
jgi:hypothetical protein